MFTEAANAILLEAVYLANLEQNRNVDPDFNRSRPDFMAAMHRIKNVVFAHPGQFIR